MYFGRKSKILPHIKNFATYQYENSNFGQKIIRFFGGKTIFVLSKINDVWPKIEFFVENHFFCPKLNFYRK